MTILDVIDNIINNDNLLNQNLKFCLVDESKKPYKIDGSLAKPNKVEDFVDIFTLLECDNLEKYKGVGISIQASNICAIDVDHCFEKPFVKSSLNEFGKEIVEIFKDNAYIEFSFSGTGLRILFKQNIINDYQEKYYIKKSKLGLEYYQPSESYRYVTLTGKYLYNNQIKFNDKLFDFLNKYMIKNKTIIKMSQSNSDNKNYEQCMIEVKRLIFKNFQFQDLWFSKAPGSGKDESERDYQIISYLYQYISKDKDIIRQLFESSPFYKSKDSKHIYKWKYNDYRYFNYIYENL